MSNLCCFCSNIFRKRSKGRGAEKRRIAGTLRHYKTTIFDALQIVYNYKVQAAADLCVSLKTIQHLINVENKLLWCAIESNDSDVPVLLEKKAVVCRCCVGVVYGPLSDINKMYELMHCI